MSNSTKAILIFLVLVLIVLGVWYLLAGKSQPAPVENPAVTQAVTNTTQQSPSTPTDAVSARDDSNASLDADLNSIDAQLQTVDTNSASVDQSLNDKAVAQTE